MRQLLDGEAPGKRVVISEKEKTPESKFKRRNRKLLCQKKIRHQSQNLREGIAKKCLQRKKKDARDITNLEDNEDLIEKVRSNESKAKAETEKRKDIETAGPEKAAAEAADAAETAAAEAAAAEP